MRAASAGAAVHHGTVNVALVLFTRDLAADGTSRLSTCLRFGCMSPLELARSALLPGKAEFSRQLGYPSPIAGVAAA